MPDEAYNVRSITMMQPSMVEAIDAYRWANKLASQSDAVRSLISVALGEVDCARIAPPPSADARPAAAQAPVEVKGVGPFVAPSIEVRDDDNCGLTPMIVQWLRRAVKVQQRSSFTEEEIYRGAWGKPNAPLPDVAQPDKGQRAAIRIAMQAVGWEQASSRAGAARGAVSFIWSAPSS